MINASTWVGSKKSAPHAKLNRDLEADVAIVGGGMAGLLSAYYLSAAGKNVVILEKDKLISGATSLTTAFLTQAIDTSVTELVSIYGAKNAKLIWQSHGQAIDLLEKIVKKEKIDCEFMRCSNYIYAGNEDEFEDLKKEHTAVKKLGFRNIRLLQKAKELRFKNSGALEIRNQAKFHPVKFLRALTYKLKNMGVRVYEDTEALEVTGDGPVIVKTKKYRVTCQYAIVATYDPLGNPKETFMKKGMYKSYVFEVKLPQKSFKEGTYEDMGNPYHYFRVDRLKGHDRIIFGGEDHRKELKVPENKNFKALKEHLARILPGKKFTITKKWTGPILEPSDGLALIGKYRPRKMVACAFSGNGMTYSAIAAEIFRDIILKKKNPYIKIYDPVRTLSLKAFLKKGKDYAGEFFGGAVKNIIQQ